MALLLRSEALKGLVSKEEAIAAVENRSGDRSPIYALFHSSSNNFADPGP